MSLGPPRPATVLLVDASRDDRAMYATYLRQHGVEVEEIGDTDIAAQRAVEADLIIAGTTASGSLDGLELVKRIRADAATKTKPVVVVTSAAWISDRRAATAAGCDVFLTKPCAPDDLLRVIRRLLRSRSPRAGATKRSTYRRDSRQQTDNTK